MTASNSTMRELVRLPAVRGILASSGPCITIVLPAYRPGEAAGTPAALLGSTLREAEQKLTPMLPEASRALLMSPLQEAAHDPELAGGSRWGRVLFRSPGVFEQFALTQPVKAGLTVGGCFSIRSLTEDLSRPDVFYILSLSKTKVELLRCVGVTAEPAALPRGVPATLEEALELEPPDHDLENRASIGSSTGSMRRVRFGTGSERETARTHLADFYKLVDRGIKELSGGQEAPLVLTGVAEEAALYREVSGYPRLARRSIAKGGSGKSKEELLQEAYAILQAEAAERHAAELLDYKERGRWSTDPDFLLHAAFEGRVAKLYLNREARRLGAFEQRNYRSWGPEELLNLAAVQTILHNGEAWELEPGGMPDRAPVAGVLRY